MECLDDRDDSIRLRALDLISGMVSKKNLIEIVRKLMSHMDSSESSSKCVRELNKGEGKPEVYTTLYAP